MTLDACRHGGMTELSDAALTEQGVMTLSGHLTPDAARLYIKRTEQQRLCAIRQRCTFVEQNEPEADVRMNSQIKSQNDPGAGAKCLKRLALPRGVTVFRDFSSLAKG